MSPGLSRRALLTVVAPCLVVLLIAAASEALRLATGRPLVWPSRDLTLSEAILLKDQAEMARQFLDGADPDVKYDVADIVRPGQRDRMTPLEAAVVTREVYMVELALGYGARLTGQNAPVLQCLARAQGAEDVGVYLARLAPVADICETMPLPFD